jgi:hypothetical protein
MFAAFNFLSGQESLSNVKRNLTTETANSQKDTEAIQAIYVWQQKT